MEATIMLLTDFIRNLRILDREFRATQGAMDHVRKHFQAQERTAQENGEQANRRELEHRLEQLGSLEEEYENKTARELEHATDRRSRELDRLTLCRLLCATARNVPEAVLHAQELEDEKVSASADITLEELLSGGADLGKQAIGVNQLYRAGKTKDAKKAWARLKANAAEAERLLDGEIRRLQALLAEDLKARHTVDEEHAKAASESQSEKLQELFRWMIQRKGDGPRIQAETCRKMEEELEYYRNKREERLERIGAWFRMSFPPMEFAEEIRRSGEFEPAFDRFHCAREIPDQLWLAGTEYDPAGMNLCADTQAFLEKYYPFLYRGGHLSLPSGLGCANGNLEFRYSAKQRSRAVKQAGELALRLFALVMPGKLTVTFADPVTLGESFAVFARLADLNGAEGNVINGRIWTSTTEIETRLAGLAGHIADVTQRCLQGKYQNLLEYNQASWDHAEGYQVLILMDYPAGMSEQALKNLDRIVRTGPKCGVFTLIWRSEEQMKKLPDKLRPAVSGIREEFRVLSFTDSGTIRYDQPGVYGSSFFWGDRPSAAGEQVDDVIRALKLGL